MEPTELRAAIEAILFVSSDPVKVDDLAESFADEGAEAIAVQLEEIRRNLDSNVGGFMLEQTAGGWRLATRAEHDPILKKYFAKKGENRLSIAALETLAIVAYRQPITAPEVSDIRGVNSTGVIRTLLERRQIRVSGRKNVVGSPFLYRTTKEFLIHFGLNDIRDLPRLEEFGDLIGENINEDLVAAINNAETTSPSEVAIDVPEGETIEGAEAAPAENEAVADEAGEHAAVENEAVENEAGDERADGTGFEAASEEEEAESPKPEESPVAPEETQLESDDREAKQQE